MFNAMLLKAAIPVLGLTLLGGCSTGGTSGSARSDRALAHADHGVMCPKCETVWVRSPSRLNPKGITTYRSEKKMVCPDCDAMAARMLTEEGKVQLHECPTCKVTPRQVTQTEPHVHQR
jgi:Zn ribbon nucleic-acid-binding protein